MEVRGVHHIELNVSDLERSFRFYERLAQLVGGTHIERLPNAFSFHLGGCYLYFNEVQARFREVTYHRKRTGLDHLAFRLGSRADVVELAQSLSSAGIRLLNRADYYGEHYFALYLEDPDRIKLEFGADTPPAEEERLSVGARA